MHLLLLALSSTLVAGQYIFVTNNATTAISCHHRTSSFRDRNSSYTYTSTSTIRYATPLPTNVATTTYAPAYSDVSTLLPNVSTTTWSSWLPGQTAVTANDTANPYGNAAWQQLWVNANLTNYTTIGLHSTTVSPTPIPKSSLIAPPALYFGPSDCYELPDDFIYGAAGAAAQVEGAIGMEGRTPSLLENIITNGTGFNSDYVAIENYYLYKVDIARLAAAGLKYYHFSISWNRIVPLGKANTPVNKEGIAHYDELINTILEHGMLPVVTIHHFDSPYLFVDEQYPERSYQVRLNSSTYIEPNAVLNHTGIWSYNGGFAHVDFLTAWEYYMKIVLTHYADRVPVWITINSPLQWGNTPEGHTNVLKAHAAAYHFYKDVLKGTGRMGMKIGISFAVPEDPNDSTHVAVAQRYRDMYMGALADPIILGKQYPEAYTSTIPNVTLLTDTELSYIGGTADFFGINEYTGQIASPPPNGVDACATDPDDPNWPWCVVLTTVSPMTDWALGNYAVGSAVKTPQVAIRECFRYLWDTYRLPIILTEFGFPIPGESEFDSLSKIRFDFERSNYYLEYLSEILKSMFEDGVEVAGAITWGYADNWEFGSWDEPYGLQYVNLTTQERSYKRSFFDFVDFFQSRMGKAGTAS